MTGNRRRWLWAVGVAVVAGLVIAGAVAWQRSHRVRTNGPLADSNPHAYFIHDTRGTVFSDGFESLSVEGDEPVTIESVRSVGGGSALRFLGARIAGPARRYTAVQTFPVFPPERESLGPLADAVGAVLQPEASGGRKGYELIIGYEVISDSYGARDGIEVAYRVGDERYREFISAGLVVCGELGGDPCEQRFYDESPGWH